MKKMNPVLKVIVSALALILVFSVAGLAVGFITITFKTGEGYHYSPNGYDITLDDNGSHLDGSNIPVDPGRIPSVITEEGYTFLGWKTGSGKTYIPENGTLKYGDTELEPIVVKKAVVGPDMFYVLVVDDANIGTDPIVRGSFDTGVYHFAIDSAYYGTMPAVPKTENMHFDHWEYFDSELNLQPFSPRNTVITESMLHIVEDADGSTLGEGYSGTYHVLVLSAQYKLDSEGCDIKFVNGEHCSYVSDSVLTTDYHTDYNSLYTADLPEITPESSDYSFAGWQNTETGEYIDFSTYHFVKDTKIMPVFEGETYPVTANAIYEAYDDVPEKIVSMLAEQLEEGLDLVSFFGAYPKEELDLFPKDGFVFDHYDCTPTVLADGSSAINLYYSRIPDYEPEYKNIPVECYKDDDTVPFDTDTIDVITGFDVNDFEEDIISHLSDVEGYVTEIVYGWGADAETGESILEKVEVYYKKGATLKVNCIGPDINKTVKIGVPLGEYEIDAPEIDGYTAYPEVLTGSMTSDGAETTVTYGMDPNEWAQLVYIAGDGGNFIGSQTKTKYIRIGTNYTYILRPLAAPKKGFEFDGWYNEPDTVTEDVAIICNFTPSDGSESFVERIYDSFLRMIIKFLSACIEAFSTSIVG